MCCLLIDHAIDDQRRRPRFVFSTPCFNEGHVWLVDTLIQFMSLSIGRLSHFFHWRFAIYSLTNHGECVSFCNKKVSCTRLAFNIQSGSGVISVFVYAISPFVCSSLNSTIFSYFPWQPSKVKQTLLVSRFLEGILTPASCSRNSFFLNTFQTVLNKTVLP